MTKEFDRKARDDQRFQTRLIPELEPIGCAPCQMIIKQVEARDVRRFISTYHYSHLMPDGSKECFIGYYGDRVAGVVVYGIGVTNQSFPENIPLKDCRELIRLWSPDGMPKNTESYLISKTLKMLPKNVSCVVSYSDPEQGHLGKIYQATNFIYLGQSKRHKMLVDGQGNRFHKRTIGSYKRRHPELVGKSDAEIMELYGWKCVSCRGKYKYITFLGTKDVRRKMRLAVTTKKLKYPKDLYTGVNPV